MHRYIEIYDVFWFLNTQRRYARAPMCLRKKIRPNRLQGKSDLIIKTNKSNLFFRNNAMQSSELFVNSKLET